jgi:uncharacterized protein YgiM (DUF1202 family)
MNPRNVTSYAPARIALGVALMAACGMLAPSGAAIAQTAGAGGPEAAPLPAPISAPKHRIIVEDNDVEPARARVKLKEDAWVYSQPRRLSRHVTRVHAGKFVNVTGSTRYYLRVTLKDGRVGYVSPSAIELVRPADKIFALTSDTPVYDQPNRWGRKVSEVHKGHSVHVVGIALNYMKIRKKGGLQGYIPASALE